jgi:eukaryotic-like serine/threonine-protein kinase
MPLTLATHGYLGSYRLLSAVYTGKSAQIWQARDDRKQRLVGIKTLTADYQASRRHIGYLRWEYKVSRSVLHPRILEIYEYAVDRGAPYVVMEWFPSENMKQRIMHGTGKIAHLLPAIIDQAAEALTFFNLQGWVHRDIKPDNFLVADNGNVKLIDFSLARRAKRGLAGLLPLKFLGGKSKVQGTRSYMSPEQIRRKTLDQRADVYSFGCTLHELISGKPPFSGSTVEELFGKHLTAAPPALDPAKHNVTADFANLVRSMLAKDPGDRPASVGQCLAVIRSHRIFRTFPQQSK